MKKLAFASLLALASTAAAQNCFEPNFGTNIGGGDDVVLSGGPIGFNFPFNGQNYTDLYVSTNGFVYLANASTPVPTGALCCAGNTAGLVASLNPIVAPFWDDLNVVVGNGAGVYVNSSASACVVTWDGVVQYSGTVPFQMQAQLLPSGEIRFSYQGNTAVRITGDVLVGVSEGNGALVPAASDFSQPGATAAVTAFELFDGIGKQFDLAGDSLSLLPTGSSWFHVATSCRANAKNYGAGCITKIDSFYEYFANASAHDLTGTALTMLNTGTGYFVLPSVSTFVPPTAAAQSLALADDGEATVSLSGPLPIAGGATTSLVVCSNGFVSVATGNGTDWSPTAAEHLAAPQTAWRCWHDYNPSAAGSGAVKFEEVGGIAYVTWDGVYDYLQTTPNTFQFQFELATGNVTLVWQSISGLGGAHVVGYSVGGPSTDSGSLDLTVAVPATIQVDHLGLQPLALNAVGVPTLGSTVTLDTTNIPAGATFGATLMGLAEFNPGIDLSAFGMAGCRQFTDGTSTLLFVAPTGIVTQPFNVPSNPAFAGFVITAQSAVFAPGTTAIGAVASNGVRLTLGTN